MALHGVGYSAKFLEGFFAIVQAKVPPAVLRARLQPGRALVNRARLRGLGHSASIPRRVTARYHRPSARGRAYTVLPLRFTQGRAAFVFGGDLSYGALRRCPLTRTRVYSTNHRESFELRQYAK